MRSLALQILRNLRNTMLVYHRVFITSLIIPNTRPHGIMSMTEVILDTVLLRAS